MGTTVIEKVWVVSGPRVETGILLDSTSTSEGEMSLPFTPGPSIDLGRPFRGVKGCLLRSTVVFSHL